MMVVMVISLTAGPRIVIQGPEVVGHHGVGYDRDHQGVEGGTQNCVLLAMMGVNWVVICLPLPDNEVSPGVAHTYDMVNVTEGELEQLICEDTGSIGEAE